jgi:hypothetical protein
VNDQSAQGLQIRIAAEQDFIEELAEELEAVDGFSEVSRQREEDPAALGFDFGLIIVLIGLASDLFFDEPLVPLLWRAIRRRKPRRIRIDTPLGTASFEPRADMTEDDVRKIVKQLADVGPSG